MRGIYLLAALLALLPIVVGAPTYRPCDLQSDGSCKCTASYCDNVEPIGLLTLGPHQAVLYSSAKSGARLKCTVVTFNTTSRARVVSPAQRYTVLISPQKRYQRVVGIGGAFTDASSLLYDSLPAPLRASFMESYFGEGGIEYSLGRVPVASSDFSMGEYSYCDTPGDYDMKTFSVDVDNKSKLPFIQAAQAAARAPLRLFSSNWSPPAWLKTSGRRTGGKMLGTPGDQNHKALALYLARFVEEYARRNITLWAMTPQNEPAAPELYGWDSCHFEPEGMRDFIKMDLGPTLQQRRINITLLTADDQKGGLDSWRAAIYNDPAAARFVGGLAFHWYDTVYNLFPKFDAIARARAALPEAVLLASEACTGSYFIDAGPRVGDWFRGEAYGVDILGDLRAGASGWCDWNLMLDRKGGPNHAGNIVDAPLVTDGEMPVSGAPPTPNTVFFKSPMFYHLGHFAKFVRPESVRIDAAVTPSSDSAASGTGASAGADPLVDVVAFSVPATASEPASAVVVILNKNDSPASVEVAYPRQGTVWVQVEAHSIHPMVIPIPV